jgi:hypothetical protein
MHLLRHRSSLLLAAFAQACEGKCPLFHYVCQNFSFKNVPARRGSLLMGKEGPLAERSSRDRRFHGEEFVFLLPSYHLRALYS